MSFELLDWRAYADSALNSHIVDEYRFLSGKPVDKPACSSPSKQLRDGANIQPAKLIKQVRPNYPPEARNYLVQGVVILEVQVNENGDVNSVSITSPVGAGADENAVEAVSQWKYSPVWRACLRRNDNHRELRFQQVNKNHRRDAEEFSLRLCGE